MLKVNSMEFMICEILIKLIVAIFLSRHLIIQVFFFKNASRLQQEYGEEADARREFIDGSNDRAGDIKCACTYTVATSHSSGNNRNRINSYIAKKNDFDAGV